MPQSLDPIPLGTQIVEPQDGSITNFFRLAWEKLRTGFQLTPTVASDPSPTLTNLSATLATTSLYVVTTGGQYRVNYALMRTVADGVSSSATVTLGWTYGGNAFTHSEAALTEAAALSEQSVSKPIEVDDNTTITIALLYASNTAAKARFDLRPTVEHMA